MVGAPDAGAELLGLGAPDDGRGFAGDWMALRTASAVRPPTRPATSTARELITRWIPFLRPRRSGPYRAVADRARGTNEYRPPRCGGRYCQTLWLFGMVSG